MLIACPNCDTSYQVRAASIGAGGRPVRCQRCQRLWLVTLPDWQAPLTEEPPEACHDAGADAAVNDLAGAAFLAKLARDVAAEEQPALDETAAWPAAEPSAVSAPPLAEPSPPTMPQGPPAPLLSDIRIPMIVDATQFPAMATGHRPPPAEAPPITSHYVDAQARHRAPACQQPRREPSGVPLPLLIFVMFAAGAALIGWRKPIARQVPQLASLYEAIGLPVNLRGLVFEGVKVPGGTHDGVPVLTVEGTIAGITSAPVEVPRLRFAMRNEAGAEIYSWTAMLRETVLAPHARLPFQSRLAAPPSDIRDVEVRFLDRRDAATDAR